MKASPTRYIRRRSKSSSYEGNFFKRDNTQEQSFFGEPSHETFFRQVPPSAVLRKCDDCEEEEKNIKRNSGPTDEDEKKLQMKGEDKKEKEEEKKKLLPVPEKKEGEKKKVQLKTADKKEDERELQKKEIMEEEKEGLHRKEGNVQSLSAINTSSYINTLNGKGNALPKNTLHFFNNRIGYDFSSVKVHTGSEAEASTKEVNAKAYTFENHIVFNQGEYSPTTYDGKKLLAHELVHTIQQGAADVSKKDKDESVVEECTSGSVDLEALTTAGFSKNAGTVSNEKTKKSKGCPDCEDECVNITGNLMVPFKADTKINLPSVPANLTPCQQDRVKAAINGPLLKHEKEHVKAFETFNGTASLKINYQGCESDYSSHQEALAQQEFQRRKSSAEARSAALDPFSVPVDLCCIDKPKK